MAMQQALDRLAAATETQNRLLARTERRERRRDEREQREEALRAPRRDFRRLSLATMLDGEPFLAAQFAREIPPEFWHQEASGTAVVACPCKAEPVCERGRIRECDCGRFFLFTGESVRVARYDEADTALVD